MEKVVQTVNAFGKLNKRDALCVSLSGVDSMVLLRALRDYQLKTKFYKTIKQFHLKAVHINYNNRSDCDKEVEFVVNYCDSMGCHEGQAHHGDEARQGQVETRVRGIHP